MTNLSVILLQVRLNYFSLHNNFELYFEVVSYLNVHLPSPANQITLVDHAAVDGHVVGQNHDIRHICPSLIRKAFDIGLHNKACLDLVKKACQTVTKIPDLENVPLSGVIVY